MATYHSPALDEMADAMGPAILIAKSFDFTAFKSEGLVRSIHMPGYMKNKLNWGDISTRI